MLFRSCLAGQGLRRLYDTDACTVYSVCAFFHLRPPRPHRLWRYLLDGRAPRWWREPPRVAASHRRRLVSVPPSLSPPLIPMPPRGGDLGLGAEQELAVAAPSCRCCCCLRPPFSSFPSRSARHAAAAAALWPPPPARVGWSPASSAGATGCPTWVRFGSAVLVSCCLVGEQDPLGAVRFYFSWSKVRS